MSEPGRRRWLAGALSALAGVAVATLTRKGRAGTVVAAAGALPGRTTSPVAPRGALVAAEAASLLAPFEPGAALGAWTVVRLVPLSAGAASVVLADARGVAFQLDICARDASMDAPRPPGHSEHFDVFLANGGEGATASVEHHGLAAMAVADVIRHNEPRLSRDGFLTLRDRLAFARDGVHRSA